MFKTRKQIIQGYFNGTPIGLIGCAITSTISSSTLMGTTKTIGSSFFLL
jgi:hypothetical protein